MSKQMSKPPGLHIHPFDQNAIPLSAFEPVKNTTTQAAQPLPAQLPSVLTPTPSPATTAAAVLTPLATPVTLVAPPALSPNIAITISLNDTKPRVPEHSNSHPIPNEDENVVELQQYHIEVPPPLPNAAL
jgi:hypothetical protein